MNTILNNSGAVRSLVSSLTGIGAIIAMTVVTFLLSSCQEDLEIQQAYPFTVEVMPFSEKITEGEPVELRLTIKADGNYVNTLYTIRYFQYEGDGTLQLVDGPVLVNNDRVLLESKSFILNYVAQSAGNHKILVVVQDNFDTTPWERTFEFDCGTEDEKNNEKSLVGTIGNHSILPISQ